MLRRQTAICSREEHMGLRMEEEEMLFNPIVRTHISTMEGIVQQRVSQTSLD